MRSSRSMEAIPLTPTGRIVTFAWSWADTAGGSGTATGATATFAPTTITTVQLTVQDDSGDQASTTFSFTPVQGPTIQELDWSFEGSIGRISHGHTMDQMRTLASSETASLLIQSLTYTMPTPHLHPVTPSIPFGQLSMVLHCRRVPRRL